MSNISLERQPSPMEYVGAYRLAKQSWYWLKTDDEGSRIAYREEYVQDRLEARYPHIEPTDLAWLGNLACEGVEDALINQT